MFSTNKDKFLAVPAFGTRNTSDRVGRPDLGGGKLHHFWETLN